MRNPNPPNASAAAILRRIDEMPIHAIDRARAKASFLLAEALVDRVAAASDAVGKAVRAVFRPARLRTVGHGRRA